MSTGAAGRTTFMPCSARFSFQGPVFRKDACVTASGLRGLDALLNARLRVLDPSSIVKLVRVSPIFSALGYDAREREE
jgi:hypothetical protein